MATNWQGRTIAGTNTLEVVETGTWNDLVNWEESTPNTFYWWDSGASGTVAWSGRTAI